MDRGEAHILIMNTRDTGTPKREEPAAPAQGSSPASGPLRARPMTGEPDWTAIFERIERDFPKTLARLAE